ncbi:MAG TPA: hypothetical protein VF960_14770 [Chloroflexota bacterium]
MEAVVKDQFLAKLLGFHMSPSTMYLMARRVIARLNRPARMKSIMHASDFPRLQ